MSRHLPHNHAFLPSRDTPTAHVTITVLIEFSKVSELCKPQSVMVTWSKDNDLGEGSYEKEIGHHRLIFKNSKGRRMKRRN